MNLIMLSLHRLSKVQIILAIVIITLLILSSINLLTNPYGVRVESGKVVYQNFSTIEEIHTKPIGLMVPIQSVILLSLAFFLLGYLSGSFRNTCSKTYIKPTPNVKQDNTLLYNNEPNQVNDNHPILLNALKGREKKIMKELLLLEKTNQAELSRKTGIPSSTLSRVLSDLEKRKLIVKYKEGMSNEVSLSDEFLNES